MFEYTDTGLRLSLSETVKKSFLKKEETKKIHFNEWRSLDDTALISTLSLIDSAFENNPSQVHLSPDKEFLFVAHDVIAEFTEAQAYSLGLPPVIPYHMSLTSTGSLLKSESTINAKWITKSGREVFLTRKGSLISMGDSLYRLPKIFYLLLELIDKLSIEKDMHTRMECLAKISHIFKSSNINVSADGQLTDMKIVHAAAMSLDIISNSDDINFNPVLFDHDVRDEAQSSGQVEASQGLLTPMQQDAFAHQFISQKDINSTYLANDTYVLLDPAVKTAARTIKKMQTAPSEDKKRFIKSPLSFISQDLIDDGHDQEFIDELAVASFVFTDEFSSRVKEIGIWSPPVLPFIIKEKNNWKEIVYGLRVAGKDIAIPEEDLERVANGIAQTISDGGGGVKVRDEVIPATPESLDAVNILRDEIHSLPPVEIPETDNEELEKDKEGNKSLKKAVIVENNFTQETFIAKTTPRSDFQEFENPSGLINSPKTHQITGISWLQECWSAGYSGVLLADDMGLGKTFQTLAFLSWLIRKRQTISLPKQPILIIAPTSLLGTWVNEAKMHLEESCLGSMTMLYGADLRKAKIDGLKGNEVTTGQLMLNLDILRGSDWVLTTYETMRDYQLSLSKLSFSCVIFDEMQKIKNITSMMTNGAQSLNGDFCIGLTGTPVENSLQDIWTLFDTLMPGKLGLGSLRDFTNYYTGEDLPEDSRNDRLISLSNRLLSRENNQLPPMIRRLKKDVAKDLPLKTETNVDRYMPEIQAHAYHEALTFLREGNSSKQKMQGFQDMRRISLHPLSPEHATTSADEYIKQSARLVALFELLDKIYEKGEKALVFVESINMHQWLSVYIETRYNMSHKPDRIFGSVSAQSRQAIVDRFQDQTNTGFDTLLLSPKAAGVGLTLTAATHVIHLTRWWNPAVEDQCTDRAYRIGQTNDVYVYYIRALHPTYGESSFDGVLDQLLKSKRALASGVLAPFNENESIDAIIDQLTKSD